MAPLLLRMCWKVRISKVVILLFWKCVCWTFLTLRFCQFNVFSVDRRLAEHSKQSRFDSQWQKMCFCSNKRAVGKTKKCFIIVFGSGCGSVDKAVDSNVRGPQFKSGHRRYIFIGTTLLKSQKLRKGRPGKSNISCFKY